MNDVIEILNSATHSHQAGNLQKAEQLYSQIIEKDPDHSDALHLLGVVAHQKGKNDAASDLIARAIASDSENPHYHDSLGLVFEAMGKTDQAICSYKKAILLNTDYSQAYMNLAIALMESGNFSAAIEKCNQIISLFSPSARVYNLMGYCYEKQASFTSAIKNYRLAIGLKPDFVEPYNHLGVIFNNQQRYDQAKDICRKALEVDPDYAEARNNFAVALEGLGQHADAVANLQKAISLNPECSDFYYNLGNCLRNQNQCAQAIQLYKKAIQIDPDYAKAHWNLAISYLQIGNLTLGWQQYQWRRNPKAGIPTYPHNFNQSYWDGSSLAGKSLLVHYEQGFGDNIQFIRYLPMLKKLGGTVICEVQQPLYSLFQQIEGVDEFVQARSDGKAPDVDFDLHISTLDLPRLFRTTLENIPRKVPYLNAEPVKTEYWRNKLDSQSFKVGIIWSGSATHENDHNRSCSLKHFAPLTKIQGVKLYGLQKELNDQSTKLAAEMQIACLGGEFQDFTDTAAAIENMDLVISVDTSVLHLAGAMGKPAWALIPFGPDWRWMLDRCDSPWYPTMRLFRQKEPGNWDGLFTQVAEQLEILVDKKY